MTVTVNALQVDTNEKGVVISWVGADTNVGQSVNVMGFGELTMQSVGNGTTVALQGSNDGGTTWGSIGAGITSTVSGNAVIRVVEHPALVRPVFTGGTVTTFYLSAARAYY